MNDNLSPSSPLPLSPPPSSLFQPSHPAFLWGPVNSPGQTKKASNVFCCRVMREWTSSGPNSQLSLAFVAGSMAPRSLKNSKATFWEVKDRERYGAGRAGTGGGAEAATQKKKPLCFYAKRLSRESSGQLGQWHDWSYMCLDDFLLKRLWFSCLSSLPCLPPPQPTSLVSVRLWMRLCAAERLLIWGDAAFLGVSNARDGFYTKF